MPFGCFVGVFLLVAAVVGVLNASHCNQPLGSVPGSHTEKPPQHVKMV